MAGIERPEKNIPISSAVWTSPERSLDLVAAEYRKKPDNPELLAAFNQTFWYTRKNGTGLSQADLTVEDCPYSKDEIRKFMGLGRRFWKPARPDDFGVYIPEVISTAPDGLTLLGKLFPVLGNNWAFNERTQIINVDKGKEFLRFGWMRTEKGIDAPYLGTDQNQAEEAIKGANRRGLTLNEYVVAGVQSKLLFGRYLDEVRSWVRVLPSRYKGQVLRAGFLRNGECGVHWYPGSDSGIDGNIGVRSAEAAK